MTDFRRQEYRGKKYLTYWNGCNTHGAHWGHRWGRVTFIDEEYNNFTINPDLKINSLDDANKGQIDVHEHQMTDDDTMVVSSYNNTPYDLTPLGGPRDSWVVDSCFFEIDIATEAVSFEWCALDHVPLENSRLMSHHPHGTKNNPYDWFHINAVQKIGKNYLISSRHHFAAYMISGGDGSILWKLDGENGGDFGSIPANFRLQHHVHAQNISDDGMTVTMFNNHGRYPSQALGLWLPLPPNPDNPPVLVRKLENIHSQIHAGTQGSFQLDLGNGNAFVGYGKVPVAREFGPVPAGKVNGELLWEGRFGYNGAAMSYRAFKAPWHGTPKDWDPVVVVEKARLQRKNYSKVFASWNGATEVGAWAVFAGDNKTEMQSVGVARKQGFETVFHVDHATCVQLGAIQDGKIVRRSNVACLDPNDVYHSHLEIEDGTIAQDGLQGIHLPDAGVHEPDAVMSSDVETLQAEKQRLEAAKQDLEAQMTQLQTKIQDLQSGAWSSYRLFAEVACGVIVIVAVTWAYIVWRERRRANFQQDNYEPSSFGLSGLGLGRKQQRTPSIRIHHASQSSVDEALMKRLRRDTPELVGEDDDEDDVDAGRSTARTPFLRQTTDR